MEHSKLLCSLLSVRKEFYQKDVITLKQRHTTCKRPLLHVAYLILPDAACNKHPVYHREEKNCDTLLQLRRETNGCCKKTQLENRCKLFSFLLSLRHFLLEKNKKINKELEAIPVL
jgi:hypothetical protein